MEGEYGNMNKCKECLKCSANPIVCEYCIYNNCNDEEIEEASNEKIIFYNKVPDDNTSQKVCPICRKIYTDYPAISRQDNKTLICSECAMKEIQEPLEEVLEEYGLEVVEVQRELYEFYYKKNKKGNNYK